MIKRSSDRTHTSAAHRQTQRSARHHHPVGLALAAAMAAAALTVTGLTPIGTPAAAASARCHGKITHLNVDGIGIDSDAIIPFATAKGFFARRCLTVTRHTVSSFPAAIADVLGGSADATIAPAISDVDFLAKGAPLKVIAASFGEPTRATTRTRQYRKNQDLTGLFVTRSSKLKSPRQLVGKTVSVPAMGAQIQVVTAWAVKKAGGDPNKVNWVVLDFLTAESELAQHKIAAAGLTTPFSAGAVEHGDRLMLGDDVAFFGPGALNGTWTTSAAKLRSERPALSAFASAVTEANAYADTHFSQFEPYDARVTGVPLATVKKTAYAVSFPATDNARALRRTMQRIATNMRYAGIISRVPKLSGVVVR